MKKNHIYKIGLVIFVFLTYVAIGSINDNNANIVIDSHDQVSLNTSEASSSLVEWNRTLGSTSFSEMSFGIALDTSNNIIIIGINQSTGDDSLIAKYDNSGNFQSQFSWESFSLDLSFGIVVDNLNNMYCISGCYNGSFYLNLLKFNVSGNLQWNTTWGQGDEYFMNIAMDSSSNIYVVGSFSNGSNWIDVIVVKFDNEGEYLWNTTWGGPGNDIPKDIILDSSRNIYVAGGVSDDSDNEDFFVVSFDEMGDFRWNQTLRDSYDDMAFGIALDGSNNVYISGTRNNTISGNLDILLASYTSSGTYRWHRTWDGLSNDRGTDVVVDSLNNIYVLGATNNTVTNDVDLCVLCYDNAGTFNSSVIWGGPGDEIGTAIVRDASNNLYITGFSGTMNSDIILLKMSFDFSSPGGNGDGIPGYDVIFIFSILGVSIYLILKKSRTLSLN
ncbi:MAG: hypothetical protein ACFFAS_15250 [Promethearchaeota archaeon]